MTNQLSIQAAVDISEGAFTPVQIDLIKRQICPKLDNNELALFLYQCKKTQLDPLCKQIYAVKRWSAIEQREVMTIQTGIGGYRTIAKRNPNYIGPAGTSWCGVDGVWKDVWTESTPPFAAKVGIYVRGLDKPMYAVARFDSYKATNKHGELSGQWPKMPDVMIAKCAESLLLRQAFPQDLSGIYTDEEMEQADNPIVVKPNPALAETTIEVKAETPKPQQQTGFNPDSSEHMAWLQRSLADRVPIRSDELKPFAESLRGKSSDESRTAVLNFIAKVSSEFDQDIKESEQRSAQ